MFDVGFSDDSWFSASKPSFECRCNKGFLTKAYLDKSIPTSDELILIKKDNNFNSSA